MNCKELLELIEGVDKSNLTRFSYKEDNIKIEIEKEYKNLQQEVIEKSKVIEEFTKEVKEENNLSEKFEYIKSTTIGTFYSSPSPNEESFICVGDKISKDQTVGIVEVMKMMNEVKSEFDGVVEEILINDKDTVEYGQDLVKIRLA